MPFSKFHSYPNLIEIEKNTKCWKYIFPANFHIRDIFFIANLNLWLSAGSTHPLDEF